MMTRSAHAARLLALSAVGAQVVLSACAPGGASLPAAPAAPAAVQGAASKAQEAAPAAAVQTHAQTAPAVSAAPAAPAAAAAGLVAVARAATLPAPDSVLHDARQRILNGEYPRAIQEMGAIQANYPGTQEAADALYFQAEALLLDDQFGLAEEHLRRFLAAHPEHPRRAVATLMLARALDLQGNGGGAIEAFQRYEALAAPGASLADLNNLRAAQIYFAAGRIEEGWAALGQSAAAAQSSPSSSVRVRLYDELAVRYWNAGDRARTVEVRLAALESAVASQRPAAQIAQAAARLVAAYQETGQRAQADAVRRRIVNQWPRTSNALQAMNELGADSVAPFQRAVINYTNRRWQAVVDGLTGYVNSGAADAEGTAAEARYMRAIALTRMGNEEALDALDRVVQRHGTSRWADLALWEAASLLLRQDNKPAAAARFEQLAVGYPASEYRGQALYWLGKLLPELGNAAAGRRYMEAAAGAGYEDFYTFRARNAVRQPAPAAKPLRGQEEIGEQERAAWGEWLGQHGYAPEAQEAKRAQVEADGRFLRGTALLEAGYRQEAEQEFLELVRTLELDPVAVEHVAVHVRERGFFPLSVTLGHSLVDAMHRRGETHLLNGPRVVQKLVLPLAFLGLVEPAARAKGLDPLLLLGLMKQESWFEPRAASTAQARGLTQFIRPTAEDVAGELSWPNWTWDDMNRPYVSVPFGAHYLSTLIRDFRGNYHFALAGYNGGPGNVLRWAKNDWNRDIDLFVEEISYAETRGYVKAVTGNYELYKQIYYR